MGEFPGVSVGSLQKRLNFALFAAGHDPDGKSLRMGRFCARPFCRSRQFLVNLDVVESAKPILQVSQTSLKVRQTLLRRAAAEQVAEKIAGITKLLDRDPQLMSLLAIKLSDLFRFLARRYPQRTVLLAAVSRALAKLRFRAIAVYRAEAHDTGLTRSLSLPCRRLLRVAM
jgi:hypothetical protein